MNLIAVIGTGTMGHGIAQIIAMSGYRVVLYGRREPSVEEAIKKIKKSLQKFVDKGVISKISLQKTMDRILTTTSLDNMVPDASIVIEAVTEDLLIKKEIYRSIENYVSQDTIITTTTSTIPISILQKELRYPSRLIGTHFFNPPQVMKLVEIMGGKYTTEEVKSDCAEFVRTLGKIPLLLQKETPGYIVNRVLLSMFLTALRLIEVGKATPSEIDLILKNKYGFPMGLFQLSDFIGLDIIHNCLKIISSFDKKFEPSITIEEMVSEGRIGIKAGRGFYEYPNHNENETYHLSIEKEKCIEEIIISAIREAYDLVKLGVADEKSIDMAVKLGLNLTKGISDYSREIEPLRVKELVLA